MIRLSQRRDHSLDQAIAGGAGTIMFASTASIKSAGDDVNRPGNPGRFRGCSMRRPKKAFSWHRDPAFPRDGPQAPMHLSFVTTAVDQIHEGVPRLAGSFDVAPLN